MLQELAATRTQFMSVGSFSQARGRNVCYMLLEQRCAADLAMLIWILSKSIWVIFYTCFQSGAFNYCIVRWNGALSHKLPGFREKFAAVVATPVESTVCCFRLYKMFTVRILNQKNQTRIDKATTRREPPAIHNHLLLRFYIRCNADTCELHHATAASQSKRIARVVCFGWLIDWRDKTDEKRFSE